MKSKLILACAISMTVCGATMAQKVKNVPEPVTKTLKAKYPQATKVSWEKEGPNFEANWGGKSGEDMSIVFSPTGSVLEQAQAVDPSALPANVNNYVKTNFAGAKIKEAAKVLDASGKVTYKAEVGKKELIFTESGSYLKTETEED